VRGSTFKRCACTGPDGRQLGRLCPKLRTARHGTWYYRLRVPGHPQQLKKGGFATQVDAEAALQALRGKVAAGLDLDAGRQTVASYLDQWLAGKIALAADTRTSYESHIRLYLKPALAIRLDDLRDRHVEEMYEAMRQLGGEVQRPSPVLQRLLAARAQAPERDRPLSPARLRRVHATLMSALNSAVRRRRLLHNPAAYVEMVSGRAPKAVVWNAERAEVWARTGQRYPVAVWTPEMAGAFLDYVAQDRLYALG